jgi:hypothetical protein
MRVAVMQPYFYPYAGYFRLIAAVDLFLVFDCVQFPRRGRVHRAPLPPDHGGGWLTLPLARQPRATPIRDIRLSEDRDARWQDRLARLPWLAGSPLAAALAPPLPGRLLPFLVTHLRAACARLGIATPLRSSSDFAIDPGLTAQARVIALARAAGATEYWNLPGGRALYDPDAFAAAGLGLRFLPPYGGPHAAMLHALATADPAALCRDVWQDTGRAPPMAGAAP